MNGKKIKRKNVKNSNIESNLYGPVGKDLEVNKKNQKEYEELMENASYNYDSYFNIENPVVKLVLLGLLVIIVFGVVYYVTSWMNFS